MDKLTLKEQWQQVRKWYLMTNTPVPGYLKEENHSCDPDSFDLDPKKCPACREIMVNRFEAENAGKYH